MTCRLSRLFLRELLLLNAGEEASIPSYRSVSGHGIPVTRSSSGCGRLKAIALAQLLGSKTLVVGPDLPEATYTPVNLGNSGCGEFTPTVDKRGRKEGLVIVEFDFHRFGRGSSPETPNTERPVPAATSHEPELQKQNGSDVSAKHSGILRTS